MGERAGGDVRTAGPCFIRRAGQSPAWRNRDFLRSAFSMAM
jgi:hypothetical protein